jgi:ParB-like nuclease domain
MFASIPDPGGDGFSIVIIAGGVLVVGQTWDPSESQSRCEMAPAPAALSARLPRFAPPARGSNSAPHAGRIGAPLGALAVARRSVMEFQTGSGAPFEIPTDWWERSGMLRFVRRTPHYAFIDTGRVHIVPLSEVLPLRRTPNLQGYSRDGFDQERMISVLGAFVMSAPLPPVEVRENTSGASRYRVYDGMHRFYAAIAAGYSHLPVVVTVNPQAFLDAEDAAAEAWERSRTRQGGAPDS